MNKESEYIKRAYEIFEGIYPDKSPAINTDITQENNEPLIPDKIDFEKFKVAKKK